MPETHSLEFFLHIIGMGLSAFAGGAGVYIAVRVDLALAKRAAEMAAESAGRAHERITDHIERHHTETRLRRGEL